MWADVRCAPSFTQHSYVCLRFYKRHVVWPLCVCVYGSWPAGWLAGRLAGWQTGWLLWDARKKCVGGMLTQVRHKNIFTAFFSTTTHVPDMSKMQLITALYSAVQYTVNVFTLTFLSANNGEASFAGAPIPHKPHPLCCD